MFICWIIHDTREIEWNCEIPIGESSRNNAEIGVLRLENLGDSVEHFSVSLKILSQGQTRQLTTS